jgi:hypothetical protein
MGISESGNFNVTGKYGIEVTVNQRGNLRVTVTLEGGNQHTFEPLVVKLGGNSIDFREPGRNLNDVAGAVAGIYAEKIEAFAKTADKGKTGETQSFGDHKFSSRVSGDQAKDTKLIEGDKSTDQAAAVDAAMTKLLQLVKPSSGSPSPGAGPAGPAGAPSPGLGGATHVTHTIPSPNSPVDRVNTAAQGAIDTLQIGPARDHISSGTLAIRPAADEADEADETNSPLPIIGQLTGLDYSQEEEEIEAAAAAAAALAGGAADKATTQADRSETAADESSRAATAAEDAAETATAAAALAGGAADKATTQADRSKTAADESIAAATSAEQRVQIAEAAAQRAEAAAQTAQRVANQALEMLQTVLLHTQRPAVDTTQSGLGGRVISHNSEGDSSRTGTVATRLLRPSSSTSTSSRGSSISRGSESPPKPKWHVSTYSPRERTKPSQTPNEPAGLSSSRADRQPTGARQGGIETRRSGSANSERSSF